MNWISKIKCFFSPSSELAKVLSEMFDINVNDARLYEEAILHCSISDSKNNERLEYLGDAVLDLIVADILYTDYPELDEGQLTKLKSKMVSRQNFKSLGMQLGMHENLPIKKQRDLPSEKIIGNVLEAIFGAMYFDQGYAITKNRATRMFKEFCCMKDMMDNMVDPKSSLLEWAQKHKRKLRFVMEDVSAGASPRFKAEVTVDGTPMFTGEGTSKKRAQMQAAQRALQELVLPTI